MQLSSVELERVLKAHDNTRAEDGSGDVVFAVFLEPHDPPPGAEPPTVLDRLVTFAVSNLQPSPVMAHVELVVPCVAGADQPVNFGTYIGSTSGWQRDARNNERYYLVNTANKWRAVPVFGKNVARLARALCNESEGVQYSLLRYATASWAFRGLSALMPDKQDSPAHCATLTARILRSVVGRSWLKHPSAWYGPASLYAELCKDLGQKAIAPETTLLSEEQAQLVDVLLRHSDDEVKALGDEKCMEAIRALTLKAASAEAFGDTAIKTLAQKQLAMALFRWSVLRGHNRVGFKL